jgi:hypothetical protein
MEKVEKPGISNGLDRDLDFLLRDKKHLLIWAEEMDMSVVKRRKTLR